MNQNNEAHHYHDEFEDSSGPTVKDAVKAVFTLLITMPWIIKDLLTPAIKDTTSHGSEFKDIEKSEDYDPRTF